jgi:hypothetical protein
MCDSLAAKLLDDDFTKKMTDLHAALGTDKFCTLCRDSIVKRLSESTSFYNTILHVAALCRDKKEKKKFVAAFTDASAELLDEWASEATAGAFRAALLQSMGSQTSGVAIRGELATGEWRHNHERAALDDKAAALAAEAAVAAAAAAAAEAQARNLAIAASDAQWAQHATYLAGIRDTNAAGGGGPRVNNEGEVEEDL